MIQAKLRSSWAHYDSSMEEKITTHPQKVQGIPHSHVTKGVCPKIWDVSNKLVNLRKTFKIMPRLYFRGKPQLPLYIIISLIVCGALYMYRNRKNISGVDPKSLSLDREQSKIMKFRQERFLKHKNRGNIDGPGEKGNSVRLTAEEQMKADSLFEKEAFNIIASDKVAMDRSVRDTRDPG